MGLLVPVSDAVGVPLTEHETLEVWLGVPVVVADGVAV